MDIDTLCLVDLEFFCFFSSSWSLIFCAVQKEGAMMFLPFTLLHYLKQNDPYFFLPIMFLKLFSSLEDKGSEIPVLFHFFIFTFQKEIMRKLILCSAFHLRKIKIKFIDTILINLT